MTDLSNQEILKLKEGLSTLQRDILEWEVDMSGEEFAYSLEYLSNLKKITTYSQLVTYYLDEREFKVDICLIDTLFNLIKDVYSLK